MNTVTHALIPVIIVGAFSDRSGWLSKRNLICIGIAGALPDLLTPHLSLEARMTSWSHGIPCWLLVTIGAIAISILSGKRIPLWLSFTVSAAYLLHIWCDAVSGGVNFLYPYKDWIWGAYWVDPIWWIPLDIVCIIVAYLMFRICPTFHLLGKTKN